MTDRMTLLEMVAVAIVRAGYNPATAHDIARAALAVIEPVVREECAKVASDIGITRWHGTTLEDACDEVAAAIRAGAPT